MTRRHEIGAVSPRGSAAARPSEMAVAASTLYAPGGCLVYASLLLPHPNASEPVLALLGTIALSVALGLAVLRRRLRAWMFPPLVTLGIALITTAIFTGGVVGPAFACFFVWSGMYAWYFFSARQAAVQTALIFGTSIVLGVSGKASALFVMMVLGTLMTVCLWLRHAVRGVRLLAITDQLTSIPNRRGWDLALTAEVEQARRKRVPLTAAMLDLDHFKVFNDEHGHQTGDLLLQMTVRLWRGALRSTDVVARYGGEEFGFLFPGCDAAQAERLVSELRRLVPRGLTCSAGIAEWDHRETADALMLRADSALYEAKRLGRNRQVHAPGRDASMTGPSLTTEWTSVVLEMLRIGEVGAVYQPVVRLRDRVTLGYESLARPHGVALAGGVENLFAAAQRMGLTREIDYLCRRGALEGARDLRPDLLLFINISVAALLDPEHAPDQLLFLLRLTQRRPDRVVLEISERESITDPARFAEAVRSYRAHGFRFALDDVGEGHSTFETLAATTPEYVKLARQFVCGLRSRGPRAAVIAACAFARESGAQVIAEGIEDEATIMLLRELEVDMGQGYHLGRPAPLDVPQLRAAALPAALGGWT